MKKTLGGDRLGAGKKQQIELHGYERSTHDPGYIWRSTISAGTLVPFLAELVLPGDTYDINLNCNINTHPTTGPLFGSYKTQLDIFQCPIRLYQGALHNNKLGIGLNMAAIKLPQIKLWATVIGPYTKDIDNAQINPSCILSYLNIRGVGTVAEIVSDKSRLFNAISYLSYWDIYKNYYANKQEKIGAVIHSDVIAIVEATDLVIEGPQDTISKGVTGIVNYMSFGNTTITLTWTGTSPIPAQLMFDTDTGRRNLTDIAIPISGGAGTATWQWNLAKLGAGTIYSWDYITDTEMVVTPPKVKTFDLDEIDKMREKILMALDTPTVPFLVNDADLDPYKLLLDNVGTRTAYMQTQEGLAIKTYQSDLFNNWLDTEDIDNINTITAIDTSLGEFEINTLILAKKVYDMLNRIAVSGGSYDDWLDAVYDHDRTMRAETPMYMGGLIKELEFQEVVSNSASSSPDNPTQPLGTLAGKGVMGKKHKGGHVTIKVDEPSYILGILSLTPRVDYSQGNKWDTQLKTMDDLHKPAMDQIGFQELIQEQMAWWTTAKDDATLTWQTQSAGKQPAWINYMTNVNQVRGNFAIQSPGEMFMTLNRRYEHEANTITDLTTYIDPTKFNFIFAQTSLDAQNFWVQIAINITARRKISAKVMPNL